MRTERARPGRRPAVCSQRSSFTEFTLDAHRAWRGRDWLSVDTRVFPQPPGSGQCAGPRLQDFTGALPSALVRQSAIRHRGKRVSLRGRFPFKSGPLSGRVISTLRLTSRGVKRTRIEDYSDEEPDTGPRELRVELRYAVTRVQGEVRNDFRAVSAPICHVRDACGTHGSEVYSLDDADKTFSVTGTVGTHSGHRPSLRRALRRIGRHGFVFGFMEVGRGSGLTTHAFIRPGGATCIDRFRPRTPPELGLFGGEGKLSLTLFAGGDEGGVLRGRCPGPEDEFNDLARLRLSPGFLLKHRATLRLRRERKFRTGAFSGKRSGRVTLHLRRTHARVRVVHAQRP